MRERERERETERERESSETVFYCMLCNWILSQWENMPDLPCLQALLWLHNHTAFLRYLLTSSRNYDSCTCMLKRCEEKVAIIFSQSPVNDFNSLCMPEKTMTDSRMNRKKRWRKPRAVQITYCMYCICGGRFPGPCCTLQVQQVWAAPCTRGWARHHQGTHNKPGSGA